MGESNWGTGLKWPSSPPKTPVMTQNKKMSICNNSIEMVILSKKHQNNISYVSKCKQKEARFIDFHTK